MLKRLAKFLAIPRVADYLIKRAQRTPYFHLKGYMERWWLFNGYGEDHIPPHRWFPWSIRVHHILREDYDWWPHDHPADCRTFILKGWYYEIRDGVTYLRQQGETAAIDFGEFHSIKAVSDGGVWTLFVLGRNKGEWGFQVNGVKIPWRKYLKGCEDGRPENQVN